MKPPLDPSTFSAAQKDALILQLFEMVTSLEQQVKELQNRLDMNSRNSGKPPSSNGPGKPAPKSRRKSSGKRSGGQPGHKGGTLKQTSHPNHVINQPVEQCSGCGLDLNAQAALAFDARQVFGIPPISI